FRKMVHINTYENDYFWGKCILGNMNTYPRNQNSLRTLETLIVDNPCLLVLFFLLARKEKKPWGRMENFFATMEEDGRIYTWIKIMLWKEVHNDY
ncbi:hypothetical protein, partial [Escherichia coli]|uniref:hypothetical protein n=1 Tax=Escherichia coli TaxID=562 RepID=UPI0032DA8AED